MKYINYILCIVVLLLDISCGEVLDRDGDAVLYIHNNTPTGVTIDSPIITSVIPPHSKDSVYLSGIGGLCLETNPVIPFNFDSALIIYFEDTVTHMYSIEEGRIVFSPINNNFMASSSWNKIGDNMFMYEIICPDNTKIK